MEPIITYRNYYENLHSQMILCDEKVGFSIPANWAFSYVQNISSYGQTILKREIHINDWLLELEDIKPGDQSILQKKFVDEKTILNSKVSFNKGMILYSKLRPYLDKVLLAFEDGVATSEIVPFWPFINELYLILFFRTPYYLNRVSNLMYGVKMPRLGTNDMKCTIIPIPPLEEQQRIVNKYLKLIKLV